MKGFDVYEKFNKGFVDEKHLTIRINALKLGTMKTPLARAVWDFWKVTRDTDFFNWFEIDMFDKESMDMRSDCELPDDKDFGRRNSAITYIWLR